MPFAEWAAWARRGSYRTSSPTSRICESIRMRAFLKIVCTYVAAPTEANVVPQARHSDSSQCPSSSVSPLEQDDTHVGVRTAHFRSRSHLLHSCWRIFTLHDTFALDQDQSVNARKRPYELPLNRFYRSPRRTLLMISRQLALLSSIRHACVCARKIYLLIRNYTINSIAPCTDPFR